MQKKNNNFIIPLIQFIIVLTFGLLIRTYIFSPITVSGTSMAPTYSDSDKIWTNKLSTPKRFDCITFYSPRDNKHIIKRIIGLPGDTVEMIDDQLFINQKPIDEPYLNEFKHALTDDLPLTNDFSLETISGGLVNNVPKNQYFVLGDNRRIADDSRYFGFVDHQEITGIVYFRYYPLNKIGPL